MWPHSLQVAAGEAAVGVGTDDDGAAALLAQRAVPPSSLRTSVGPPDLGLELHPEPPAFRGAPRALPSLHHGTKVIGRCADIAALRDGLYRTLASIATPTPPGHVRISGLPLLEDGGVALAPPDLADRGSHRRLVRQGLTPVYVPSVIVDPQTLLVHIPAPLVGDGPPIVAPLVRWWLPLPDSAGVEAPPSTLGRLVAHAAHRLAPPWFDDEMDALLTGADDSEALTALVELVARRPPILEDFRG